MEPNDQHLFDLQVDRQVTSYLNEAAKWGKFLSIVGFIFCGLLVIVAFFAGTVLATSFSQLGAAYGPGFGTFMTILYIAFALLYFFPCLYLYNFSVKMIRALRSNDQLSLTESFKNLRSCYKFLGILTISIISFYVLGIFIAIFSIVS